MPTITSGLSNQDYGLMSWKDGSVLGKRATTGIVLGYQPDYLDRPHPRCRVKDVTQNHILGECRPIAG